MFYLLTESVHGQRTFFGANEGSEAVGIFRNK